jgi:hypothetical protein
MPEYSEPDLVIPALQFIRNNPGATTTELKEHLISLLHPTDHDAEILQGRSDSYFTQKVRNLKSHNTLTKHNWVRYQRIRGNGVWRITQAGTQYLRAMGY